MYIYLYDTDTAEWEDAHSAGLPEHHTLEAIEKINDRREYPIGPLDHKVFNGNCVIVHCAYHKGRNRDMSELHTAVVLLTTAELSVEERLKACDEFGLDGIGD